MRPYTDTPAEGGPRFWEIGVSLSGYDAMMSWLRLLNSLSAKSVLAGEKLVATYSIST